MDPTQIATHHSNWHILWTETSQLNKLSYKQPNLFYKILPPTSVYRSTSSRFSLDFPPCHSATPMGSSLKRGVAGTLVVLTDGIVATWGWTNGELGSLFVAKGRTVCFADRLSWSLEESSSGFQYWHAIPSRMILVIIFRHIRLTKNDLSGM